MIKIFISLVVVALFFVVAWYVLPKLQSSLEAPLTVALGSVVRLETSQGVIKVKLYNSESPKTSENFLKLVKQGFYDGLSFHRVIPEFMVQAGDPNCGRFDELTASKNGGADSGACGAGGPGYKFDDEINASSDIYKKGYKKGILAMANSGPHTNGSQFFIMVNDVSLPKNYTIFGEVAEGQDVADALSVVERNASDRPLEPVVITKAIVE